MQVRLVKQLDDKAYLPEYVVHHNHRREVMDFCELWNLEYDKLNLHYDIKEKRVVFPVKKDGLIVDAVGRSVGFRLPKWKRYGNSDLPYYLVVVSVAVVVEDCVSAICCRQWCLCRGSCVGNIIKRFTQEIPSTVLDCYNSSRP